MTRVVAGALGTVVVLLMGGLRFIFSGIFDVSADAPHWPITRKIMEIVRDRSVEVRARAVSVPNLSDDQAILKGAGQYAAMCANCHLAPGQERSEIRPGLYPQPPDLSKHAVDPKTAFWVIKHGIKMSGMPAWGRSHDDATLWSIVAFMQKLPGTSPEQYKEMVAKAPTGEHTESADRSPDDHSEKNAASGKAGSKANHKH